MYEVKSVYEDGIVKGMTNKRNDNDDSNGEIKWQGQMATFGTREMRSQDAIESRASRGSRRWRPLNHDQIAQMKLSFLPMVII